MKKNIMSIVVLTAVAVAGVSCLQLEQPGLNEILSGDEIVFGADAHIEAETKASSGTTETTSLTSFYVSAVTGSAGSESSAFNSTQFTQVTGSSPAVYTGGKMWAATDQGWKFYASNAPLTFHADGTTVAATNTTDVVCAYLTNGTYKTKNTLTFEHIFARFGRVDVAAESGYTISNISIRITPKTGGTYNLRTGAGQSDGSGWSSVTTGSATVVANQVGANGNDIYLVPGTYQVTATWTATQSGTSITYTDKVVNVPIVGGKTNVVSVVLGGEILLGVDLQEYCDYDYRDNLDYLTFYCDEAGTIGWSYFGAGSTTTIQYSKDFGTTWTNLTSTSEGATFSVSAGDIVWFKGNGSSYKMNHFTATNKFHVYGNINSLLNWNNTFSTTNVFQGLFYNCSTLYTYKDKKVVLPTLNMTYSCYNNLFYGCSSMEYAPDFPATTLAQQCYSGMFRDCTSLKEAPEFPATTMADNCYSSMFRGCTSLVKVSDLPATVAAPQCYYYMFEGCTSLKVAPVISATVLAQQCCTCMFKDCTSLPEPPELPATTLAEECYGGMFQGCSSLVKAPDLPATVMAPKCHFYMFSGCTSLKVAPVISATVLAQECCYGMFDKCTALTVAPELPATTLAVECYTGMFQYCSSLVKAPELPATALVSKCYSWMFFSCSSLNYIKAMFTTTPSDSYTEGWVDGVAARGTFVKSVAATWNVTGNNGVPTGWSVMAETPGPGQWMDNPDNYLRFKFVTDGQVRWQNKKGDIQYSKNGGAWTAFNGIVVSMSADDEIWFKGDLTSGVGASQESTSSKFYISGKFYVSGNVQSLCSFNNTLQAYHFGYLFYKCEGLNIDDNFPLILPATTLALSCYSNMFFGCSSLTSAPELPATTLASSCYNYMFVACTSLRTAPELPATTLASSCYYSMFQGCSSLRTAPELPATTLASSCYYSMFQGCSSLRTAPELPATTLESSCYYSMFQNCSSLTSAPELPATTLANYCYQYMFAGCYLLTSAPELPATTLANYCYYSMFQNCSSLTSAPELPAMTLKNSCYYSMFQGCSSLTTAPELPATTLVSSCYYSMFQNCSSLTSAPELPAKTLVSSCYSSMFYGCSSLNYIKALFNTTPSYSYTRDWVYGVASTGIFVKYAYASWSVSGSNGVPSGWTIVN